MDPIKFVKSLFTQENMDPIQFVKSLFIQEKIGSLRVERKDLEEYLHLLHRDNQACGSRVTAHSSNWRKRFSNGRWPWPMERCKRFWLVQGVHRL